MPETFKFNNIIVKCINYNINHTFKDIVLNQ